MAETHDIHIDKNADFRMILDYRNPDNTGRSVTGYTFRFGVKVKGETNPRYYGTFEIDPDVEGRFTLTVKATETAVMNFGQATYDIIMISPGTASTRTITRACEGRVFVHSGVSKAP